MGPNPVDMDVGMDSPSLSCLRARLPLLLLLLLAERKLGEHQVVVLVEVGEGDVVDAVDVGLLLLVDPGPHERGQEDCT
jgi:hypothetical protein